MDTWEGFYPELPSAICWLAAPHTFTTYCAAPHPHNRCISALASNHASCSLVEASRGLMPPHQLQGCDDGGCLLPLLEQLTLALVAAGGVGACDEEPWLHDCTEMMLEVGPCVWGGVLVPLPVRKQVLLLPLSLHSSPPPPTGLVGPPAARGPLRLPGCPPRLVPATTATAGSAPRCVGVPCRRRGCPEGRCGRGARGENLGVWCGGGLQIWAALKQDFFTGMAPPLTPC